MTKTCFEFMSFFIRICFGFRNSDFEFIMRLNTENKDYNLLI